MNANPSSQAVAVAGAVPATRAWQRWQTLVYREWLQHRTGWLVMLLLPTVLTAVTLLFLPDAVQVDLDLDTPDGQRPLPPLSKVPGALQMVMLGTPLTVLTVALVLLSIAVQLPGLARRDAQDRSLEFWRSLPVGDPASLSATLCAHLLLLPVGAVAVGVAGSLLVGSGLVIGTQGLGAWLMMPWGKLAAAGLALCLRLMPGLVLAMLWLSPLILLTMAASAWLKRWGVPLVTGLLMFGTLILDRRLPSPVVTPTLAALLDHALGALVQVPPTRGLRASGPADLVASLGHLPSWALQDLGRAAADLATPAFVLALAGAALGFALLVWRRRVG